MGPPCAISCSWLRRRARCFPYGAGGGQGRHGGRDDHGGARGRTGAQPGKRRGAFHVPG